MKGLKKSILKKNNLEFKLSIIWLKIKMQEKIMIKVLEGNLQITKKLKKDLYTAKKTSRSHLQSL